MDSVATVKRRDSKIRSMLLQQDLQRELGEYSVSKARDLVRGEWECRADIQALRSRVRWEMGKVTDTLQEDLRRRRERLSNLLKNEEEMYQEESRAVEVRPNCTMENMMARYKELKMIKEEDRQKIVKQKRKEQFRRNCEELRTLSSRQLEQAVAEEGRIHRLELDRDSDLRTHEEEGYAELWKADVDAKELREIEEKRERKAKGGELREQLEEQMAHRKLQEQRKLREKEEDKEVMDEQRRLNHLEDEWSKHQKKQKQENMKTGLDDCLRSKLKRRCRKEQDDLLEDLFFLKRIMDEEDEAEKNQKKQALLQEQHNYMNYLDNQMRAEKEFEKNLEQILQEDLDRIWERRQREVEENRLGRRRQEQDVMQGVREQMKEKLEHGKLAREYGEMYGRKVIEEDERDRNKAKETLRLIKERNAQYQKELMDQIRYRKQKREEERILEVAETEALMRQRKAEEEEVRRLISEGHVDNKHPYRLARREIYDDCHG